MEKFEDTLDFLAVHAPNMDKIPFEEVHRAHHSYGLGNIFKNKSKPSAEEYEMARAILRYEWASRMIAARQIVIQANERT